MDCSFLEAVLIIFDYLKRHACVCVFGSLHWDHLRVQSSQFAWRGMLMDTDRHWLSMPHIYRIIDALGYTKMNTCVGFGNLDR